eukprot:COSAG01_NODE_4621_length_4872_cov_3.265451_7_plen_167_part_00
MAAVLTEIYLCNVGSCEETLRRHGRGQAVTHEAAALESKHIADLAKTLGDLARQIASKRWSFLWRTPSAAAAAEWAGCGVRCALQPVDLTGNFPMGRVFLSRNIEGAADAGREERMAQEWERQGLGSPESNWRATAVNDLCGARGEYGECEPERSPRSTDTRAPLN